MKRLALTLSYQNEETQSHIIERIEADTMVELVSRFLLMSHVVNKAIKDDEMRARFLKDNDDNIPF
jgi:hypothetical protein